MESTYIVHFNNQTREYEVFKDGELVFHSTYFGELDLFVSESIWGSNENHISADSNNVVTITVIGKKRST
jgi:hypothetical protein